jgi:hypothetical protein
MAAQTLGATSEIGRTLRGCRPPKMSSITAR